MITHYQHCEDVSPPELDVLLQTVGARSRSSEYEHGTSSYLGILLPAGLFIAAAPSF